MMNIEGNLIYKEYRKDVVENVLKIISHNGVEKTINLLKSMIDESSCQDTTLDEGTKKAIEKIIKYKSEKATKSIFRLALEDIINKLKEIIELKKPKENMIVFVLKEVFSGIYDSLNAMIHPIESLGNVLEAIKDLGGTAKDLFEYFKQKPIRFIVNILAGYFFTGKIISFIGVKLTANFIDIDKHTANAHAATEKAIKFRNEAITINKNLRIQIAATSIISDKILIQKNFFDAIKKIAYQEFHRAEILSGKVNELNFILGTTKIVIEVLNLTMLVSKSLNNFRTEFTKLHADIKEKLEESLTRSIVSQIIDQLDTVTSFASMPFFFDYIETPYIKKGMLIFYERIFEKLGSSTKFFQGYTPQFFNSHGIQTLDLSSLKMGDNLSLKLFNAIETNISLTSLNLRCNLISDNGVSRLAESLKYNKGLTSLNLQSNLIFQRESLKKLATAWERNEERAKKIHSIDISCNYISENDNREFNGILNNYSFFKSSKDRQNERSKIRKDLKITHNAWLVFLAYNLKTNHAVLFIEGIEENGQLFLEMSHLVAPFCAFSKGRVRISKWSDRYAKNPFEGLENYCYGEPFERVRHIVEKMQVAIREEEGDPIDFSSLGSYKTDNCLTWAIKKLKIIGAEVETSTMIKPFPIPSFVIKSSA